MDLASNIWGQTSDGIAAALANITPESVALLPSGDLVFADREMNRVRAIGSAMPGLGTSDMLIASHDGKQVYVFDQSGRHLRTVDAMTGVTLLQFGYDSQGRVATLTDRDGNQTSVERDASGAPTAIVAPFGQRTTLSLGADGLLQNIADPTGSQVSMTYANGLLQTYTDARGGVHRFQFDANGLLIKDQDPAGGSKGLNRTMTETGFNVDVTTAMGRTTSHKVDFTLAGGTSWTNTAPDGTKATSSYDLVNWSASFPDGSTQTSVEAPDPRFLLQAPVAAQSTFTTPGGLTWNSTTARTAQLSDPGDPLSVTKLTETTTVNDNAYTSTYDASSMTLTQVSPSGRKVVRTLDSKGRVIRTEVAGLAPVTIAYDEHGRATSVVQGSRQVSLGYDSNGHLSSITDPLSRVVGLQKDLVGRVTKQTAPDGAQTLFSYDAASNITSVTPPGKQPYGYGYTSVDQESSFAPPAVGTWDPATNYSYDVDQALTSVSRPDAKTVGVKYDSAGRPIEVDYQTGPTALSYDSTGQLASATTPLESLAWTHDASLVTQATWSGAVNGSVEYSYDNDLRLTSTTVNRGLAAERQYDADGLLVQTGDLTITRDAQNGLVLSTDAGAVHEAYAYNEFGEVTSFTATNLSAGTTLLDIHYTRDALGRITKKVETTDGVATTYEYGYDSANRLAEVKTNGVETALWAYDANGNRTSETKGGTTVTATYDGQDRLVKYGSATYSFGNAGELQSRSRTDEMAPTQYRYNALGDLVGVTQPDGTLTEYVVDAQGRRVGKRVNGTLVQAFLWEDQLRIAAELDGNGTVVSRFVYGDKANAPELILKGAAVYRVITDNSGSPRFVVDTADGSVLQRIEYDEWGSVKSNSNWRFQPFGFAGGLTDPDTGLVRFGVRDYDSESGRFLSPEPLADDAQFAVDEAAVGLRPARYVYALNNPLQYYDPDGLQAAAAPWLIPWEIPELALPEILPLLPWLIPFWPAPAYAPEPLPPPCSMAAEHKNGKNWEKHSKKRAGGGPATPEAPGSKERAVAPKNHKLKKRTVVVLDARKRE